ncbi:MAG: glycosyltransferase family 2 protein [Myxococcales bacterium]|nr:glycosyltransferase family 2 protein [Myxococcales bacterium]
MSDATASVIIPVYNDVVPLRRALESVLAQSWEAHEIIVVDDGSTADVRAALEGIRGPIRVIRQRNMGVSVARNVGIQNSSGKYVAFLDADDTWRCDKLEAQLRVMEAQEDLGLTGCAAEYVAPSGMVAQRGKLRFEGDAFKRLLLYGNFVVTSSAVVRRAYLDAVASPWFPPGIPFAEDWALWLRLAARFRFFISNEPMVRFALPDGPKRSLDFMKQFELAVLRFALTDPAVSDRVYGLETKLSRFVLLRHARRLATERGWRAAPDVLRAAMSVAAVDPKVSALALIDAIRSATLLSLKARNE